jgi:dTDP-4-amino-4,6-dideoxygalactose transaminase
MVAPKVPRFLPWENDDEFGEATRAATRVLASGVFIDGPEVAAFENEAADFLGLFGTVGVGSGTDALTIALIAATRDSPPTGEVLVPALTFVATAEAIIRAGFTPRIVDISLTNFLIDISDLQRKLNHQTRAILPVSLYGCPIDIPMIADLAQGLPVIEDACQAFGAELAPGIYSGTLGSAGGFSFFPSKPLGAFGDGGLIASNDADLLRLSRVIARHGCSERYCPSRLGFNSRLDAIQAAMLRTQLRHTRRRAEHRTYIARTYKAGLDGTPGIVLPELIPGHAWHCYTIRVLNDARDQVQENLRAQGIDAAVLYPIPLHRMPHLRGIGKAPVADIACSQLLCLPIWSGMLDAQIEYVIDAVRSAVTMGRTRP